MPLPTSPSRNTKSWTFALLAAFAGALSVILRRQGPARFAMADNIGSKKSAASDRPDSTVLATRRYLLYVTIPLWVGAGLMDYVWHRRTKIETTSGTTESLIHILMMAEAGLPMLLGLFLEINAGVILLMSTAFLVHAATAIWDVTYAVERRKVEPIEQHVHSFLEVLPFCAVSFVICLHPDQFAALLGWGSQKSDFRLRLKRPALPLPYIAGSLSAVAINSAAYGDELLRCLRAQSRGLAGSETPAAAHDLYAD